MIGLLSVRVTCSEPDWAIPPLVLLNQAHRACDQRTTRAIGDHAGRSAHHACDRPIMRSLSAPVRSADHALTAPRSADRAGFRAMAA